MTTEIATQQQPARAQENKLIIVSPGRPEYPVRAKDAFGISPGAWMTLVDAIWPSATTTKSVELALAYCRARNLDPFKRPVHIVPIWDSKQRKNIETVWPGIGELRTTAARTTEWAGNDEAVFGPEMTQEFRGIVSQKEVEKTVTFPSWCQFTVYRMVKGVRVAFPGPKVRWLETYATMGGSDVPNEMWATRPFGQLEKCAEAAALRRAFPEEIGSDLIADEAGGRHRGPILDVKADDGISISAVMNGSTEPQAEDISQEPITLDAPAIERLQAMAAEAGVSWDAILTRTGPLEEFTGESVGALEAEIAGEIKRQSKGKKKGEAPLFEG